MFKPAIYFNEICCFLDLLIKNNKETIITLRISKIKPRKYTAKIPLMIGKSFCNSGFVIISYSP
jgi:hypothetical protein